MFKTIEKVEHEGYRLKLILHYGKYYLEGENLNVKGRRVRKRWSLHTDDLGKAKDGFYREKLDLQKTGQMSVIFESGIESLIKSFLDWSKTNSKSPRTFESHTLSMRYLSEFIKVKKIEKLSPQVYEAFKKHLLDRGNSPRTVDIRLTAISALIRVNEDLEIIPKGVIPKPKLIREKRATLPQFWADAEVQAVLREAKKSYLSDMILFGLNTGLRRIELVYLRWDDITFQGGFFNVQGYDLEYGGERFRFEPKDHETRRIKLNQQALEILMRLRDREAVSPWVFANRYGKPREFRSLNQNLAVVTKRAGVREKGGWHAIRRTFAVHLLMRGADLESLRQLLGHSEISTTQAYLNVTNRHLDDTVDLIGFQEDDGRGKVLSMRKSAHD
ncbi:MAG: tyrosine-type recombinase/integrase [Deltaproteobacteria bacterium]|nr:tyrosine-type recombinase/integrase [Candidatus Zymogenaceae bacterium]